MKSIRIGLLGRIIIAIALGILFGNFLPEAIVRIFVTFNGIFSEFLGFIIPLIILGLVTPAIADIGSKAGRMLVVTTLVAYSATLISGFLSYFTGSTFFPDIFKYTCFYTMEIYFQFQKQQVNFPVFCKKFAKNFFFLLFSGKNVLIFPSESMGRKVRREKTLRERKYIFYIPEQKRAP